MLSRRLPGDLLIAGAAIALTALYVLAAPGAFPLDDSWIHQTYARNLGELGEWSFYPGVPSAASTSPLYTVVLAIGYVLRLPFELWAHGLGALALAGTGLVGRRLVERLQPEVKWAGVIGGLALVCAWHLLWAAASGMETMMFSFFTLLLIALIWRELDAPSAASARLRRAVVFGFVAGLTVLSRPDGVLLIGILGAVLLIARPNMRVIDVITFGIVSGVVFLLVLSPYLIFNLQVTGGVLPNTSAAKQAYARPLYEFSLLWRLGYVTQPLLAGGQLMLIPGMIVFPLMLLRRRASILLVLPLLWGIGEVVLYAAYLPLPFQHGRYVIPALPALIVAGVAGTAWLVKAARKSAVTRVVTSVLSISAAALFLFFVFGLGLAAYRLDVRVIEEEMVAQAMYIRDNLPPDELLVIHDIGAVGYFAPRPMLDVAGLVSPEFIPLVAANDVEAMWEIIENRDGRYLLAFPDQVPGDNVEDTRLCPIFNTPGTASLTAGGGKMTLYALSFDDICPSP